MSRIQTKTAIQCTMPFEVLCEVWVDNERYAYGTLVDPDEGDIKTTLDRLYDIADEDLRSTRR